MKRIFARRYSEEARVYVSTVLATFTDTLPESMDAQQVRWCQVEFLRQLTGDMAIAEQQLEALQRWHSQRTH